MRRGQDNPTGGRPSRPRCRLSPWPVGLSPRRRSSAGAELRAPHTKPLDGGALRKGRACAPVGGIVAAPVISSGRRGRRRSFCRGASWRKSENRSKEAAKNGSKGAAGTRRLHRRWRTPAAALFPWSAPPSVRREWKGEKE